MSYDPTKDFLALLRLAAGVVSVERMPGLDYVVAALARAGLFRVYVGQTAPIVNQAATVWLQPSLPSWVAEGDVFLWNATTSAYELATPALWAALLAFGNGSSGSGYTFQRVTTAADTVNVGTTILAVDRVAPAATALLLPSLTAQFLTGRELKIADWSSGITNHLITLTTPDGSLIMRQPSWGLASSAVQLSSVTLHACPDLNGWIIAP
jgi:hypothetical protein